ncbi:LysR family transcriptional regulator [Photobacterium sp. S4TG1]|uniref:LysR family transcriptional regulator n=1 Tax=Photobacterium sp. S4TG1 TaxID=3114587 RepID=UPI002E1867B5|nr:LysR family transcriptional regulator [Photobacterium sp. S4TG1]
MLNYDEVVTILTICDYRNFTKAAKILYIGQPALSKKVRDIENKLGYKIFMRNRGIKSIELSEKAHQLIPILHQIKQLNKDALEVKHTSSQSLIKIASSDGPYTLAIDDAIEKLYSKNNNVIFKIKNISYKECFDALEANIIDIAFVGNNIYRQHINTYPLYEEKMVFICHNKNKYGSVIDLNSLDVSKSVYSAYSTEFSSWFKLTFNNERPLIQCDLISQVERYVNKLELWSIVPYSVAEYISKNNDISIIPLKNEPPKRLIYYAVKANNANVLIDDLLSTIKETLSSDSNIKAY